MLGCIANTGIADEVMRKLGLGSNNRRFICGLMQYTSTFLVSDNAVEMLPIGKIATRSRHVLQWLERA